MSKNYLGYLLRNYRIPAIFFAVVYFGLSAISVLNASDAAGAYVSAAETMSILAIIMTFIMPVILFSFVHRRRSADQFLALPISRSQQLITNLVFAFAFIYGSFLITSLVLWLFTAMNAISFLEVVKINGLAALMTAVLLLVHTLMFLIAGNTFDGIVMIGAWSFVPLLALLTINSFINNMVAGGNFEATGEIAMWLSPLAMCVKNMFNLTESETYGGFSLTYVILCLIYAIAAGYGLYSQFIRRKSERAEQLSDHPLAYRLIINLYAAACLLGIFFAAVRDFSFNAVTLWLLLLFIYVVAQFVYRRRIQLTPRILGTYLLLSVCAFMFAFAAYRTHGFGLAEKYTVNEGKYLTMRYSCAVERNNLSKPYIGEDGNYWNPEKTVTIDVNATIPVSSINADNRIWQIMETRRHEGIDCFYSGTGTGSDAPVDLTFANCDQVGSYSIYNSYTYRLDKAISMEDLIAIESAADSSVTVTDYSDNYGTAYSLSEWLDKKGD